jgi:hypothetical protein
MNHNETISLSLRLPIIALDLSDDLEGRKGVLSGKLRTMFVSEGQPWTYLPRY